MEHRSGCQARRSARRALIFLLPALLLQVVDFEATLSEEHRLHLVCVAKAYGGVRRGSSILVYAIYTHNLRKSKSHGFDALRWDNLLA
jgi:hypothetical protein